MERETGVEPATFTLASISSLALCVRDQGHHHNLSTYMPPEAPSKDTSLGTQPAPDDPSLAGLSPRSATGFLAVVLRCWNVSAATRARREQAQLTSEQRGRTQS